MRTVGKLAIVPSLALVATLNPAGSASAEAAYAWFQQAPLHAPPARQGAVMAPHPGDQTVVMFGGYLGGSSTFTDETWTWDGADWTKRAPAHAPTPRSRASMALDPATGKVLLFGGQQPGGIFGYDAYLADTWQWDGVDWVKLSPAHTPPHRAAAVLAHDPVTNGRVLFGGSSCMAVVHGCLPASLADTWSWNGSDWTRLDPLHDPLSVGAAVGALDEGAPGVVFFGGSHCEVGVCTPLEDMYAWDGSDWDVRVPSHRPTARSRAAGAYDADFGQLLLFGGHDGATLGDTWAWDGVDWTALAPVASPAARFDAAIGADPVNPGLVLFGGAADPSTVFGDTWLWTASSAAGLAPLAAPVHVGGELTLEGAGITAGTVLKVFLSTATGTIDLTPDGLTPTSTTLTTWTGTLPFGWPVGGEAASSLGNGFVALQLVRTDQGYDASETRGAVLLGNAALGVPSITAIGGAALSATSTELIIGTANVEGLVTPGAALTIDGEGFDQPLVNIFTAEGNVGPLVPSSWTSASLTVAIPGNAPIGPGSLQVVNATGAFLSSNAVAIPIGETISVTGVSVDGDEITVSGTGFNALTVVNLFASSGGSVDNAGGLDANGDPRIAVTVVDSQHLHFTRPAGLDAGAAYVQAVNPPFIPFTSSGDGAGGSFVLP